MRHLFVNHFYLRCLDLRHLDLRHFNFKNYFCLQIGALVIGILSAGFCANAFADNGACEPRCCSPFTDGSIRTYLGVEGGRRILNWQQNFGDNVFRRKIPYGNIFAGLRIAEYFGIEVGFEESINYRDNATLYSPSDIFLGSTVAQLNVFEPINFVTHVQTKGWHGELVGFIPVPCWPEIKILGQVGLINMKITHEVQTIADGLGPFNINVARRFFRDRKLIARAAIGVQYYVCANVGFRALLGWDYTSKFKDLVAKTYPANSSVPGRIKMRNSTRESIGIFMEF